MLSAQDRALVNFATALTLSPANDSLSRVEALRLVGFDDRSILAATQITSYFNFVNRMAHALGVELESS